ncbi:MAG: M56 family metallopeptidase, partial [Pseudomonadota bacterium]
MTDWLLDTLLWTAGLIALVLVLRRPVAKMFGPQIAYALWAIPAVRLILPPLELPAWLNPEPATPSDFSSSTGNSADPLIAPLFENVQPHTPAATLGRLDAAPDQFMPITPLPILEIGMSVWLVGAALFLTYRFAAYFRLRAEMLRDAREVGRYGKIRLLETPEAHAPLAFGVLDPVVALPPGFMAQTDRTARDLALAHELSHHVARDLLANMIVQPLFALHWFNPLGRYGWLAMRRDQEAACDARVMATKPADERAAYASLIASFAAGPKFALAAPMACPVLGEKSIVHRLRSLKLSNMSVRRRIAGRFMVGAALLALPLTASISYAEEQVPEPPAPPAAPLADAAPLPPKPPTPPAPPAP